MNVARIVTNETCNHHCGVCNIRQDRDRAEVAAAKAIRERIDRAHRDGAKRIVITGGEPTLRPDLPAIVRAAGRDGTEVVLETNAALITPQRARQLAAAGLATAVVHVPAWADAADEISQTPGAFADMKRGADALVAAGVSIELAIPVVVGNESVAELIPAAAADHGLAIDGITIVPVLSAPAPDSVLAIDQLCAAVVRVARAAKLVGIAARLSVHEFVPPCAFDDPGQVAHLYSMTPGGASRGGYERAAGCAGCAVEDRCPGLSRSVRASSFQVRPMDSDRMRRRLSIISSVSEQIARELVTREVCRRPDGETIPSHTVRINFHCNQACRFCFVSTHLPPATDAAIVAAIDEIAAMGGILVLSGGEPTLNAKLVDYIVRGRDTGAREIVLQTNATRVTESMASELAAAGLTGVFVSFHGATAETSDTVTDAPGTFVHTCAGLDALANAGVNIQLNFVFCDANYAEFPAMVSMVAKRWPAAGISVSFVAGSTDMVPRTRALIPRYSDIMPALAEGLVRAEAAGIHVDGFESMCGIPLCLVPGTVVAHDQLAAAPAHGGEFIKPECCTRCAARVQCFGVRRGYADLHGIDELSPL